MSFEQLGRFKITGTLGRGAMGTVYKAHDPLIDRTVAIKTVACAGLSAAEAEAYEQRFYREARSAGRLNHPNIVTIHDVGRNEELAYIAMEFLTGQTLRDMLDSGVVLPPERAAEIAAEVADGLAFAHANEVVHRDIKPANIMVLANGGVKIADFGVALMPSSSSTMAGTAFGSPKYMSPEQVTGQKVDGRSDIFALGVVLYEMLVGRPPFDGEELATVLYQVLHCAPPLPSTYRPGLPAAVDRVVARALAKDPDKRYQDVAEMAADLRKCRRLLKQAPTRVAAPATQGGTTAGPGDATTLVQVTPAAAPSAKAGEPVAARRPAAYLRYGIPLALLAVGLAGWLLRPGEAPAPASDTGAASNTAAAVPAPAAVATAPVEASAPASAVVVPAAPPAGATPTPEAPAEGRVRLAITPWGEVYVDGKKAGVTPPLTELRLPPGKHVIEIRNGDFPARRQTVELTGESNLRIKHKFQ